jgi:hypothetical protein
MITYTGRQRYRVTSEGLIVLQIEEQDRFPTSAGTRAQPNRKPIWRDATIEDLTVHGRPPLDSIPPTMLLPADGPPLT